jgi:hypothetical protein
MPAFPQMPPWTYTAAAVLAAALVLALLVAALRNRRFLPAGAGQVFTASRLTRGNHLFPTQVAITPTAVVRHTPHLVGHHQETIPLAQVASVTVDSGLAFANVIIETTGGSEPIRCHGHRKGDAARMKTLIEQSQTGSGRQPAAPADGPTRACPFCAETIKAAARLCRFCGRDVEPA